MVIKDINTKTILDSRGNPTLETQLQTDDFSVKASVPSGKSCGASEAVSQSPVVAVEKMLEIKNKIVGRSFFEQKQFDNLLIKLDGTSNKFNLGGNLILSLSLAFARVLAKTRNMFLWQSLSRDFSKEHGPRPTSFPYLFFNVINGGVHSSPSEEWIIRNGEPKLSIQEFQIIPMVTDTAMALSMGMEIYKKLGEEIKSRFGDENIELGDEAGYIAPFDGDEDALDTLYEIIKKYKYPVRIGLDVAASEIFKDGSYNISGNRYSPSQLLHYYNRISNRYNLISIEDPFDENSFESFSELLSFIKANDVKKDIKIITDDLTTTNPIRVIKAVNMNSGNALLIKPNQIGTITETFRSASIAYANNWITVASHRSGETTDSFIADLAVAIGSWGIKSGAPATPFRMSKYERLVEIDEVRRNRIL